jgi:hypothetical protein
MEEVLHQTTETTDNCNPFSEMIDSSEMNDTDNYWTAMLIHADRVFITDLNDYDNECVLMSIGESLLRNQDEQHLLPMLQDSGIELTDHTHPVRKDTLTSADSQKWRQAEQTEMEMLKQRDVLRIATLPFGTRAIPTKWVLTIKSDGKYKARLVACGNREKYDGVTYSPTTNKVVTWLLFALMVYYDLKTRVIDITGAFTAERCPRDVYLRVDKQIYKLYMNLYGLSDAAKEFHDRMSEHLVAQEYQQSKYDQCLFFKWINAQKYIYIIVHVDDFQCSATSEDLIDEFCTALETKYQITTKPLESYLGISIKTNVDGDRIFTRPVQLQKIFKNWLAPGHKIKVPTTPMAVDYRKGNNDGNCKLYNKTTYQQLLGALMQLLDVRPDIAFAISKCAQRTNQCDENDAKALMRIVTYLYGTQSYGLRLRKADTAQQQTFVRLRAYTDAAYANMQDAKSQYSFGFDLVPYTIPYE